MARATLCHTLATPLPVVDSSSDGASIARGRRLPDCLRWYIEVDTIRSVKGALSSDASPTIVRPTGEELYVWFIWWSIIGGVHYNVGD